MKAVSTMKFRLFEQTSKEVERECGSKCVKWSVCEVGKEHL